ncbi:MAG: sigma 54-interacting transcriptional regulator [Chitinophagales bacterium]
MSKVQEIMKSDPVILRPWLTVREAARVLNGMPIDWAPVLNEEMQVLGIFTRKHVIKAVTEKRDLDAIRVEDLMKTGVVTARLDDSIEDARFQKLDKIPVVDKEDQVQGILTLGDLVDYYSNSFTEVTQELNTIINSLYNPVISIDQEGKIRLWNKAVEKLSGKPYEHVIGQPITNVLENSRLIEVLETGETQSTQMITVAGREFISNRTPIIKDGKIIGAVAVLQEISELEQISQELAYVQRLNRELDAIIESSFDGLYVTDGLGYTLRVNKGFERITGVPAHEHIGVNMADLVAQGFYSRSGTLLALDAKDNVTITLDTITGKTVLVTSSPIYDEDGKINLVVTNVRDVTELNQLQRRLEQVESLSKLYQTELQQLKLETSKHMVVRSVKMKELIGMVTRLAEVDSTLLIQGESGVGKEMIAEIIHTSSGRKDKPFIKVNCGAIPENLLESELFGYDEGAFTGAKKEGKPGLFELANGGTIFLDEIGELPLLLQVKLLRVLQDMEINRVGGVKPIKIDVRVIAATNQDLELMIKNKEFREDLYYRLNVVPVMVPPLRERREEIPFMVAHFVQLYNRKYGLNKRVAQGVVDRLMEYPWPGNIRELENLVERLVVITTGNVIEISSLPAFLGGYGNNPNPEVSVSDVIPLKTAVESLEKQILQKAYAKFKTARKVAVELGVDPSTVVRKAAKYGIKVEQ